MLAGLQSRYVLFDNRYVSGFAEAERGSFLYAAILWGLPCKHAALSQRPLRPHTTREREKVKTAQRAAQPTLTTNGSPCRDKIHLRPSVGGGGGGGVCVCVCVLLRALLHSDCSCCPKLQEEQGPFPGRRHGKQRRWV